MTRRIVIAILIACWSVVLAGGAAAYWATRSVLLADLDAQLVARAASVPEIAGAAGTPAAWREGGDRYFIEDNRGQTLARQPADERAPPLEVVQRRFSTIADSSRVRTLILRGAAVADGRPITMVYSGSADRFDAVMRRLAWALVGTGLFTGLAGAAAAVVAARAALRPLHGTAEALAQIDEVHLDRRIDAAAMPSELAPVAGRLNDLLARLERAFAQRRRFLAEAAHELRTPVAALVTTLEVALRRPRDAAALTATLGRCLNDASHLRTLVDGLMRVARSESAPTDEPAAPVDVVPTLLRCADVVRRMATPRGVTLDTRLPTSLILSVSPARLESTVTNLLANAVEYTRAEGHVELTCEATPAGTTISVADNGAGIPADVLPNLFEPFVRGKHADGSSGNGHLGLGLAIVKGHVAAMGGRCEVSSRPGAGTVFRILLKPPEAPRADVVDESPVAQISQ